LVSSSLAHSKDIFEKSGKVFVVDAQNGGIIKEFSSPKPLFEVAYSPDGHHAVIGNHGEVIIIRRTTGMPSGNQGVIPLAFAA